MAIWHDAPIRKVTQEQIEQALAKALSELTGATYTASIIRLDHEPARLSRFSRMQRRISQIDVQIEHHLDEDKDMEGAPKAVG